MTLKPRFLLVFLASGALFVGAPALAQADGPVDRGGALAPAAAGGDEARLRAFETPALGAEHAAAHARQREVAQEQAQADGDDARPQPRAAPAPVVPAAVGGLWGDARPIPVIAINSVLLPTGKVLMFAYPARPGYEEPGDPGDYAKAYVWDPVSGTAKQVDPPLDPATGKPTNIWCGGASLLPDGRVLVTGGNVDDPLTDFHGLNTVFIFNPFSEQWDTSAPMKQGRWYPSQVLMPDGRTLIAGGLTRPGDDDFGVGTNMNNDLELIAPDGSIERQPGFFNGGGDPPLSGLYPRMFWMPSGRALSVGPYATDTWFLSPRSPGSPASWENIPDLAVDREWGTAVLQGSRVLTFGGSGLADGDPDKEGVQRPGQSTTEYFDENDPGSGWRPAAPMAVARSHANSVLLPDGTVATVGGGYGEDPTQGFYRWLSSDDQKRVELFDPSTNSPPVLGNAQAEARTYHSTALLLPDGRVMSAGDDINGPTGAPSGTNSDTAEIYSPPYLFKGPRPSISRAPSAMPLGASFEIEAAGAAKAVLVAPGASTHATDMSQRVVPLATPVSRPGGRFALTLPADGNLAPPGYYMLFVLSADGVPSVSKFIRIGAPASGELEPYVPPAPTPTPPAPAPASKPKLTITGALPSLPTFKRKKRFVLTVKVSEPGTVTLVGLLERGRKKPARSLVQRRKVILRAAGKRRVTFKLTRAGLRLLANKRRGVVRIRAKSKFTSGRTLPVVQVRRKLR